MPQLIIIILINAYGFTIQGSEIELGIEGLSVLDSLESLRCVLEQDTLSAA